MKIQCRTLFDCSRTGVTGTFRASEIPYQDRAGQMVNNHQDWNRSRNQQRNYETLLQIFGLRTQPQEITQPECRDSVWQFSFESENEGVFGVHHSTDPLAGLKIDCEGVPMMLNLTETSSTVPVLTTQGPQQNIWFDAINTSTEN
jgi:hypothetical protein